MLATGRTKTLLVGGGGVVVVKRMLYHLLNNEHYCFNKKSLLSSTTASTAMSSSSSLSTTSTAAAAAAAAAAAEAPLLIETSQSVRWIRFNRPKQLNSLTLDMFEEMIATIHKAADDPDVNYLAFTGNGHYYSSGNDLSK